jgi:glutamine amidotransferase
MLYRTIVINLIKPINLFFRELAKLEVPWMLFSVPDFQSWLKEVTVPFLGICLGMQLLFEHTTERATDCLGIISGTNERFKIGRSQIKVPHMGWNQVQQNGENPLFSGMKSGENFYFVHSYYAPIVPATIGRTDYDVQFTSALQQKNYYGVQFHPEKSGKAGLQLLNNFIELCS